MRHIDDEEQGAPYSDSRRKYARMSNEELDRLFYLKEIRCTLYQTLQQAYKNPWAMQQGELLNAKSRQRAEWLFATHMLTSYGQSIPQIEHLLESVPSSMQADELKDKREEMILKLAGTKAGNHWMKCIAEQNGWSYVAQYLCGEGSQISAEEMDNLLLAIDQISIMHDLLRGRGREYGLAFQSNNAESVEQIKQYCRHPEKAGKILRELHRFIDGRKNARTASMPVRAMMELRILTDRLPWEFYSKEFNFEGNNKSSYNDYTNKEKDNPFVDNNLYRTIVESFEDLK